MSRAVDRAGLAVADEFATFIEARVLPGLPLTANEFWRGVSQLYSVFTPENRRLLKIRDDLQSKVDGWHESHCGQPLDSGAYRAFLATIGYLVPEPTPFLVDPSNVDSEIAGAGPQLVVPVLNARFALNAANARWGSLYDALYGTDAIERPTGAAHDYDPARGAKVIACAREFLDRAAPLPQGRHAGLTG